MNSRKGHNYYWGPFRSLEKAKEMVERLTEKADESGIKHLYFHTRELNARD